MITYDQLVYISRSQLAPDTAPQALAEIAKLSLELNVQNEITGALTLIDGYFVQLLEGAPASLDILLLHLHFDTRHTDIQVMARDRVPHRAIPLWGMITPDPDPAQSQRLSQLVHSRCDHLGPWRELLLESLA